MTKNELLQQLKHEISPFEEKSLQCTDTNLVIGKYNRQSMLELLKMDETCDQIIDTDKVDLLRNSLQKYLDQYMEQKEGHKWVILASTYYAFILEIPLHPIEVTKIKTIQKGDVTKYYCPCRDASDGSLCHLCVCMDYNTDNI